MVDAADSKSASARSASSSLAIGTGLIDVNLLCYSFFESGRVDLELHIESRSDVRSVKRLR